MTVVGLLLAGGQSRRMGGGDKFLREISGIRLLDRALARLTPQVDQVVLSANGNEGSLAGYPPPIVRDGIGAGRGPLAGILAGLRWSLKNYGSEAVLISMPSDTPFFPMNLVKRLIATLADSQTEIAVAASNGRVHHAIAAWPVHLGASLERWLAIKDSSAVHEFFASRQTVRVDFTGSPDPFFNVNTPDDLYAAGTCELRRNGEVSLP